MLPVRENPKQCKSVSNQGEVWEGDGGRRKGTHPKPAINVRMSSLCSGAQLRPLISVGQVSQIRVENMAAAPLMTSMMALAPSVMRGSERSTRKTCRQGESGSQPIATQKTDGVAGTHISQQEEVHG